MADKHEKLEVSFVNDLDVGIDLYWIAHSGEHQMFHTIKKNSIYIVNTYVGHRYVQTKHERCVYPVLFLGGHAHTHTHIWTPCPCVCPY